MRKKRGIALFTVLVLVSVLLVLTGSFVKINQHRMYALNNDQHHESAIQAAHSVLDYCFFRLEQQRQWASAPFSEGSTREVPGLGKIQQISGTTRIEGEIPDSHTEFSVTVLNNIEGSASRDGVAEGYCRLRIETSRGSVTISREALLGTAPIFDAGVLASENIVVNSQSLTISSTDPFRNRIRAKGSISVPDYVDEFRFDPAADATETGILWAKEGITMGGKALSNPDYLFQATEQTRGQLLPQADTHHDIYDLQMSEVRAPEVSVNPESGIYVFNQINVDGYVVPVLERRDSAITEDGVWDSADNRVEEVWLVNDGFSLPDNYFANRYNIPPKQVHRKDTNTFSLDWGVQVHFNSLNPRYDAKPNSTHPPKPPEMVLNSNVNLSVAGDFGITSFTPDYDPIILFRDPDSGAVGGEISGSITTHATNGKPGSIFLRGKIEGNGKLIAEGDVTVRNTYAKISSDEQSDLSIFAGGSVMIRPQEAKWFDEYYVFKGVEEGSDGTTQFRGLVFAQDDVYIEANKKRDGNYDPADIFIEGAVVARKGSVHVDQARHVNFKYNPEYLDSLLKNNADSRIRLEKVVWKER